MFDPLHWLFRAKTGLGATPPIGTAWYKDTRQPQEDTAARLAFRHYGLFLTSYTGAGFAVGYQFGFTGSTFQPLLQPINGLGGLQMGNAQLTALLVAQRDAVARGWKAPDNGGNNG